MTRAGFLGAAARVAFCIRLPAREREAFLRRGYARPGRLWDDLTERGARLRARLLEAPRP